MRIHLVLSVAVVLILAALCDVTSARLTQRQLHTIEERELFFTPPSWWNDSPASWWNHIKGWSKAQWQDISKSELAKWS